MIWAEQEPGSGGKESAENTVRNLAGYSIRTETVTGDKVTRADPYAAQAGAGNVDLLAGAWNEPYLEELAAFPNGRYKDQVDSSSGAFNKLALGSPLFL
jgi:predicted phage terminase large subunit-like protein